MIENAIDQQLKNELRECLNRVHDYLKRNGSFPEQAALNEIYRSFSAHLRSQVPAAFADRPVKIARGLDHASSSGPTRHLKVKIARGLDY